MLVDFAIRNFRSFGDEQTFSMVASQKLKDHPSHCVPIGGTGEHVLQTAVIYGANAAGKSNLVKALSYLRRMAIGKLIPSTLRLIQFRFQQTKTPTKFVLRFLVDDSLFEFDLELTSEKILHESLGVRIANGRDFNIYTRQENHIRIGKSAGVKVAVGEMTVKALQALNLLGLRPDQLLLTKILDLSSAHRGKLLDLVSRWFTDTLSVIEPESTYHSLVELVRDNDPFRRFSGVFLKNVSTGIDELKVDASAIPAEEQLPSELLEELQSIDGEEPRIKLHNPGMRIKPDPTDPTKVILENLMTRHQVQNQDYPLRFEDESDGTQRCLHLLPAVFDLSQRPRVYVIDELDRSLHPLLAHSLMKLFSDSAVGRFGQLIVTTHETHLLDQDLLRRDEVYFVEKDAKQQSRLTSLADFNIRNDLKLDKGYLQGRFGGIPFIGDTQKLLDLLRPESTGAADGEEKKSPARPHRERRS